MHFRPFLIAVAVTVAASAQTYTATSHTAMGITGDVTLTPTQLTMVHQHFPLTLVKEIDAQHLADAGKIVNALNPPTKARLYRTRIPASAILLNKNTICGPRQDATWLLVVESGADLSFAVFSGPDQPDLTPALVANTTTLCGTYLYQRPTK